MRATAVAAVASAVLLAGGAAAGDRPPPFTWIVEIAKPSPRPYGLLHGGALLLPSPGGGWRDATPRLRAGRVESVFFLDRRNGWLYAGDCSAAVGDVHRTRDGGRTWRLVARGFTRSCSAGSHVTLQFVTGRVGWLHEFAASGNFTHLHRTLDGGRSWRGPLEAPREGAIRFRTRTDGWLVLDAPVPAYATTNGGRTWRTWRLPRRGLYSPPFFFGRRGVLGVATPRGRRATMSVLTSTDGGVGWRVASVATARARATPPKSWDFARVDWTFAAASPRAWWFVVREPGWRLYVTRDAGRTWRSRPLGLPGRLLRVTLSPRDARHAWVQALLAPDESRVYETSNGGRTWQPI